MIRDLKTLKISKASRGKIVNKTNPNIKRDKHGLLLRRIVIGRINDEQI